MYWEMQASVSQDTRNWVDHPIFSSWLAYDVAAPASMGYFSPKSCVNAHYLPWEKFLSKQKM